MNWKNEATWAAIGGGLVAILTGTGLLVGSESASATAAIANLSAGLVGLVTLVRAVRARTKAGDGD